MANSLQPSFSGKRLHDNCSEIRRFELSGFPFVLLFHASFIHHGSVSLSTSASSPWVAELEEKAVGVVAGGGVHSRHTCCRCDPPASRPALLWDQPHPWATRSSILTRCCIWLSRVYSSVSVWRCWLNRSTLWKRSSYFSHNTCLQIKSSVVVFNFI